MKLNHRKFSTAVTLLENIGQDLIFLSMKSFLNLDFGDVWLYSKII